MKYLVMLLSGLADEPVPALGNKTPLEVAHTPALDEMARQGKIGCVRTLPPDLPASEEVALISALGYDPHKYFVGEAGLAVAASGLKVGPDRLAFVHNLCTEAEGRLVDHAAGQITPKEAEALLIALNAALGRPEISFYAGRGFTGVTVLPISQGNEPKCIPPELALGLSIEKSLPQDEIVQKITKTSREVFREHEVNRVRADLNENPADVLWLWGPGRLPVLPPFKSQFGLSGAMIAAAESARGLGQLAGLTVPHVPGATGGYKTDYAAKAQYALEISYQTDFVVLHVAAPADAALEGNVQRKIAVIQDIDALIVAPALQRVLERGDMRVLILATHLASTLQRKRLHTPSPLLMFGAGFEPLRGAPFSESAAQTGDLGLEQAHEILPYFLTR